ncbi:energy transducer TonB [Qipengyuania sediminis]|uniref:energy transducer TonB n=1 Tax=Qipengyuania sediminis TaxID=1532023 RepID=UPI001F0CF4BA|nr:energy transducer TonB [Qipengyuania sediminis]
MPPPHSQPIGNSFLEARRRPRWWVIALIVLAHIAALYGLVRAFAPDTVAAVEKDVLATFNVTITAPPPPKPPQPAREPKPDEGAAGDPGEEAVPKAVTAPPARIPARPAPVPRASSTGSASSSGAVESGLGTGAAGSGLGTGGGRGGSGQGGGAPATKPVKIAGDISSASDFPVPPGGRQARFGTSVTVVMTVGTDGRARNCRVLRPSPDAEADAIVCRLAEQRFRFRPATDGNGNPVPATYGWRQEWFAR